MINYTNNYEITVHHSPLSLWSLGHPLWMRFAAPPMAWCRCAPRSEEALAPSLDGGHGDGHGDGFWHVITVESSSWKSMGWPLFCCNFTLHSGCAADFISPAWIWVLSDAFGARMKFAATIHCTSVQCQDGNPQPPPVATGKLCQVGVPSFMDDHKLITTMEADHTDHAGSLTKDCPAICARTAVGLSINSFSIPNHPSRETTSF